MRIYVAAIAARRDSDDVPLGRHRLVSSFMHGAKRLKPVRPLMALFHCMVRYGTVHFWGVFHWVLYLVPGTFLVPPQPRFQASRTVT